ERDRGRVAEGDRGQRQEDDAAALPVEPEGDREQPAHGRVQPVEDAEPHHAQPRPQLTHAVAAAPLDPLASRNASVPVAAASEGGERGGSPEPPPSIFTDSRRNPTRRPRPAAGPGGAGSRPSTGGGTSCPPRCPPPASRRA